MVDTCKNCTVRGDKAACLNTPCNTRHSWYAMQLAAENVALRETHRHPGDWRESLMRVWRL